MLIFALNIKQMRQENDVFWGKCAESDLLKSDR